MRAAAGYIPPSTYRDQSATPPASDRSSSGRRRDRTRSAWPSGSTRRSGWSGDAGSSCACDRCFPQLGRVHTHAARVRRSTWSRGRSDTVQRNRLRLKERQHPIIQEIGGRDRHLPVIQRCEPHLAVGVDECLLIDAPDALERPHREGVLGAAIARTLALEFARGLLCPPSPSPTPRPGPPSAPAPLWATFAASALSRFPMVCRSCQSQILCTPAGEIVRVCFHSSLATRT